MKTIFTLLIISGGMSFFSLPNFFSQKDPTFKESMQRGKEIYSDICFTCHMPDGKGDGVIYPPLAGSDFLLNNRIGSIKAVKYGVSGKITVNGKTYYNYMENPGLTTKEVADVMNYILNSWGNTSDKMVTPEEVESVQQF